MGGHKIARSAALGGLFSGLLLATVAIAPAAHASQAVTANPDNVHTTVGAAVNFDPVANDTIGPGETFNFVEIESQPSHGKATVNGDNRTIHYVPDPGYTGPDAMEYNVHVCQQFSSPVKAGAPCVDSEDTGDVTITIDPSATTTTVTVAPLGTTNTTAAKASTSTSTTAAAGTGLPNTGSTSGPFVVLAMCALAGGGMLIASARRRAARR